MIAVCMLKEKASQYGCMVCEGVGVLTKVEGNMDKHQYVEIWVEGLMESVEKLGMDKEAFYFQQDNDPKYIPKLAAKWFEDMDINL